MDTSFGVCVCAENYYQTSVVDSCSDGSNPVCAACPAGRTTQGVINGQDINKCGKYSKTLIVIFRYHYSIVQSILMS